MPHIAFYRRVSYRIGIETYANIVIFPDGKEIIVSFQDVITGKVKKIEDKNGNYHFELQDRTNNTPKPCSLTEHIAKLLNGNPLPKPKRSSSAAKTDKKKNHAS